MKNFSTTKVSRAKLMEIYSISKSTVLKLEKSGRLTPFYLDDFRRKPFYDLAQMEAIFTPAN